jgi:hypothetical protein
MCQATAGHRLLNIALSHCQQKGIPIPLPGRVVIYSQLAMKGDAFNLLNSPEIEVRVG